MKVLFVCSLDSRPPLGVMQLSAIARRAGWTPRVVDLDADRAAAAIVEQDVDLVAFSFPTCFAARAESISRNLRTRSRARLLAGGPHATFHPQRTLARGGFDAVCQGEGDVVFGQILQRVADGAPLTDVPNLFSNEASGPPATLCPLVRDLDQLPFPDRDLFSGRLTFGERVQPFMFTRGCPFNCTYCFEPAYRALYAENGGTPVRRRSVESAIDELDRVGRSRSVSLNILYDDTFNLDRGWLESFCDAYQRQITVPFSCKLRPDLVDMAMATRLARAGCRLVFLGLESGNPRVREFLLGRRTSDETLHRASAVIRQAGIELITYNIVGVPRTTIADDLSTLDLNLRCRPHMAMVMFLQPYAGTQMHRVAAAAGRWVPEQDDERLEQAGLDLYDRSLLRFSSRAEQRQIHNLRDLFGLTVAVPPLRPLIPTLIKLPLGPLYSRLGALWYMQRHFHVLYPRMTNMVELTRQTVRQKLPRLDGLITRWRSRWHRGGHRKTAPTARR